MDNIFAQPGKPLPHGATIVNDGVNFSVFTRNGTSVILDIFENPDDETPCFSYTLDPNINRTGDIWHVFLKGLKAGALYLYRVDGPFNPEKGHRFNKNTYLLDPYAKSFTDCSVFAFQTWDFPLWMDRRRADRPDHLPHCQGRFQRADLTSHFKPRSFHGSAYLPFGSISV